MDAPVKVACVQAEPVMFDRAATIDKLASLTAEAAGEGASLVVFPEAFIAAYPSNRWARYLAGWDGSTGKELYARLARSSVEIPGPASDRLAEIARESKLWLAVGANELERGTIYNALLLYSPEGELAIRHRKLMPTNHERLIWGLGTAEGLTAVPTELGRIGGLICWENMMPLARAALYEDGVEIYVAPTADDTEQWQDSMRHIAREARAFVVSCCILQRASSYPEDVPISEGPDLLGRGGSAILAPDASYLAGPLWDEEGILYAELDPQLLYQERQRFDPAGHYSRPDVLELRIRAARGPARSSSRRPSA
jgi:nitrilase